MDILERASLGLPTGLTIEEMAAEEVDECEACQ